MKIPPGVVFNIGMKEYREGMELPPNAPEAVVKRIEAIYEAQKNDALRANDEAGNLNGNHEV